MNKNNKNSKKKTKGKSLNIRFVEKKRKKFLQNNKNSNVFVCEAHAHCYDVCGERFVSKQGSVSCPNCGNEYCRWENYKSSKTPLSLDVTKEGNDNG